MAFTNLPAVDAVIEQTALLQRRFHDKLMPGLAYSMVADRVPIAARGGETLTLSRPSLFPLAAQSAIVNPLTRNNVDNGLTPLTFGYEQVLLAVQEWATPSDVSLEQEQVLIASLLIETLDNLAQNAGATFDQNIAIIAHAAAEAGNTFATAAGSGATVHVDNVGYYNATNSQASNGFLTAYSSTAGQSPGLPQTVSASNPQYCNTYSGSTGDLTNSNLEITSVAVDATNTSTANVNGVAYGFSGTITFSGNPGTSISQGDIIVATDGSYIIRPNGKLSRYQLASSDTLSLVILADAAAKLKARAVPRLPNGLYAAIVDPLIMPQLINDTAWQRATMGGIETMRYFKTGVPLPLYGIEVVESNMVPYFTLPTAGTAGGAGVERHALVCGKNAFLRCPYEGLAKAVAELEGKKRGLHIVTPLEFDNYLVFRNAMDRLGDWVSMLWKWTGAFAAMTDYTSDPTKVPTSDYSRYKRMVEIGVYNAS